MKLTEYTFKKRTFAYVATILIILGGLQTYLHLGRLEFPNFTIKTALVITSYPGASAEEVEQEVTDVIETAVQQLGQVDEVRSISRAGSSTIYVDVKTTYDSDEIPQIWDELRRKVNDAQRLLPSGAGPSMVNDDFGDVYGVFFAVSGDGFTYRELEDYVKILRRELLLVKDVAGVETYGDQTETVYLEISRAKMTELGVCLNDIVNTLNNQGKASDGGRVRVNDQYVRIVPTGGFGSLEDMKNLVIRCGAQSGEVILRDLVEIQRGYADPPQYLLMYNGKPALGIGVSTTADGNVVTMGKAVRKRMEELSIHAPAGMEIGLIAYQSDTVTTALNGFVINFVEAVGIVIIVLFITMGLASGMMMGFILMVTILGTFIGMRVMGITLQTISLGGLILSLGMLVDNAIVVTEGILVRVKSGIPRLQAALEACTQSAWPLLGATIVAILAFAGIGTSPDSTGEFLGSLFKVIGISLGFSWILALTLIPLFCVRFFPSAKKFTENNPYAGRFFTGYRKLLDLCLKRRAVVLVVLIALVALAVIGFGHVEKTFFPASDRPQFMIDFWLPEGTHIEETAGNIARIAEYVRNMEGVTATTTFVGRGSLRFILTYDPEQLNSSYGQTLVTVDDYRTIKDMVEPLRKYLSQNFPNAEYKIKPFFHGPKFGAGIEARFSGPDPEVLRNLAGQAKAVMDNDGGAVVIRDNWRQPVETIQPVVSEAVARRTGVTRPDVSRAVQTAFDGQTVGMYREGDTLLPIVLRLPEKERDSVELLSDVRVFAPSAGQSMSLHNIVTEFQTVWENPIVWRYDRKRTITAMCDPLVGNADPVFARLRPQIEAIPLPPGYELEWGGEYEHSLEANEGLFKMVPLFFLGMVLTILAMFNSIRQTLIIFLCLPLAIVGIAGAFLLSGKTFDFSSTLGFLGLFGMLIKNGVVLIDQINIERGAGKALSDAILDSSVSRLRPVCMASLTTILGMAPLIWDPFFGAMALTIIGGLAFGTVLTLVIVPVLYSVFHGKQAVGDSSP